MEFSGYEKIQSNTVFTSEDSDKMQCNQQKVKLRVLNVRLSQLVCYSRNNTAYSL